MSENISIQNYSLGNVRYDIFEINIIFLLLDKFEWAERQLHILLHVAGVDDDGRETSRVFLPTSWCAIKSKPNPNFINLFWRLRRGKNSFLTSPKMDSVPVWLSSLWAEWTSWGGALFGACWRASSLSSLAEIAGLRAPLLRLTWVLQDSRWEFWFAATAEK